MSAQFGSLGIPQFQYQLSNLSQLGTLNVVPALPTTAGSFRFVLETGDGRPDYVDNVMSWGWNAKQADPAVATAEDCVESDFPTQGAGTHCFERYWQFYGPGFTNVRRFIFCSYEHTTGAMSGNFSGDQLIFGEGSGASYNTSRVGGIASIHSRSCYLSTNPNVTQNLDQTYMPFLPLLLASQDIDAGLQYWLVRMNASGQKYYIQTFLGSFHLSGPIQNVEDATQATCAQFENNSAGLCTATFGLSLCLGYKTNPAANTDLTPTDFKGGDGIAWFGPGTTAPTAAPDSGMFVWFDAGSGTLKGWKAGDVSAKTFVLA